MAREIKEFTQYISPDGEIYRFDLAMDRFLISETGYGMPPVKYLTQRGPAQHGNTVVDYRLDPRVIQLVHRSNGCSRLELWNNRAALLNLIRPNRSATMALGKLRKILEDGTTRDIDVTVEEGPAFQPRDPSQWDEWAFTETIRFIAPDPTFYNPTASTASWTLSYSDHLIFPFSFDNTNLVFASNIINDPISVVYTGTWKTYPTITVTGPIDGFRITNETTDERITYVRTIALGETVTFDLSFGQKTATSNVYGNVLGAVSSTSDLTTFHIVAEPIASGGTNTIRVFGYNALVGTTTVSLSYNTRYIGI